MNFPAGGHLGSQELPACSPSKRKALREEQWGRGNLGQGGAQEEASVLRAC